MTLPITRKQPVEVIEGRFTLRIPLDEGGEELIPYTTRIAEIDSDYLHITLPDWLVDRLGLFEGSVVVVDNRDGQFNVRLDAAAVH